MATRLLAAPVLAGAGLLAAVTVGTFVDASGHLVAPSPAQLCLSALVALLVVLAVWLVRRFGPGRAAVLVVPYLVVFLALEVGTRLWSVHLARSGRAPTAAALESPDNLGLETVYVPHYYTLYNPRPDYRTTAGTVHNNLGFRDERDFDPEQPAIRIVFVGGSTVYEIGIPDNRDMYSFGLERLLGDRYGDELGGYPIQVINAGMGGAASSESLQRLIYFVSEVHPDLVVIQQGLNDVWPRITNVPIRSDYSNIRKAWSRPAAESAFAAGRPLVTAFVLRLLEPSALARLVADRVGYVFPSQRYYDIEQERYSPVLNVGYLVTRLDVELDPKYLAENGTEYFERNTRYMIAIARAMGAEVLLVTEPYTERAGAARLAAMPVHNALVARIAAEEGTWFYDFAAEMTKDDAHMPDGRHMSQAGTDLRRDLLYRYFVAHAIVPQLYAREGGARSAAPSPTVGDTGPGLPASPAGGSPSSASAAHPPD